MNQGKEIARLPIASVNTAFGNPEIVSLIKSMHRDSPDIPYDDFLFMHLCIMFASENPKPDNLRESTTAFKNAYRSGDVEVGKSGDESEYILYLTGSLTLEL